MAAFSGELNADVPEPSVSLPLYDFHTHTLLSDGVLVPPSLSRVWV